MGDAPMAAVPQVRKSEIDGQGFVGVGAARAIRQIERARAAAELLAAGEPALDVVAKLGYFDEPHLARALRSYVGRTVGQLREGAGGAIALDLDLDQRLTS